jgi:hypothetical protein
MIPVTRATYYATVLSEAPCGPCFCDFAKENEVAEGDPSAPFLPACAPGHKGGFASPGEFVPPLL